MNILLLSDVRMADISNADPSKLPKHLVSLILGLKNNGIESLYFWCNSIDDLTKMTKEKTAASLSAYTKIIDHSDDNGLRVTVKGNPDLFDEHSFSDLKKEFIDLGNKTLNNENFELFYFVNYTTEDDYHRAIGKVITNYKTGGFTAAAFDKLVRENMDEPEKIDAIVKTGAKSGNRNLSGFNPIKSPKAEIIFVEESFFELTPQKLLEHLGIRQNNS